MKIASRVFRLLTGGVSLRGCFLGVGGVVLGTDHRHAGLAAAGLQRLNLVG